MDVNSTEIDPNTLVKWQETLDNSVNQSLMQELPENLLRTGKSPFPFDEKINQKIIFWVGNVWLLKVDAIVCCNNENFTLRNDLITKHTILRAGKDLMIELRQTVKFCKTGEAKLTPGYMLPASHIIHTVSPKYNNKYATAAETSLHNAYRNVLVLARDNRLRTLGLRCIHSSVCKYPPILGAHVALRTVRRFLEKWGDEFEFIVLAVSNHNREAYNSLLPLYFPRSNYEEMTAINKLPLNIGDENGQLYLAERQIRISANPTSVNMVRNFKEIERYSDEEDGSSGYLGQTQTLKGPDKSFMRAKDNIDKERIRRIQNGGHQLALNNHPIRKQFYRRLLIRANKENFTDLIRKRFLYQSGFDRQNRPVIVFVVQKWLAVVEEFLQNFRRPPLSRASIFNSMPDLNSNSCYSLASSSFLPPEVGEKHRLFFIHQLDAIVNRPFVFIYIHSLVDKGELLPSNKCMQALLGMLDPKYISNLAAFYILHSTFVNKIKSFFKFPTELYDRTVFLKGVEHLYSLVSPDQLELPEFVLAHDLDLYGVRYFEQTT